MRGRAVTLKPFRDRALLTIIAVSAAQRDLIHTLTSNIDLTGLKGSGKVNGNAIERHTLRCVSPSTVAIEPITNLGLVHSDSIAGCKRDLRPGQLAPRLFIPKHVHRTFREDGSDNAIREENHRPWLTSIRIRKVLDLFLTICGMVATQLSNLALCLRCFRQRLLVEVLEFDDLALGSVYESGTGFEVGLQYHALI